MASLKDTKKRIGSVKSTQKITRAMKLVSSAKYAKAFRALTQAAPYDRSFRDLLAGLLAEDVSSPLLETRTEQRSLVVVITADRGLCGGLNANALKQAQNLIREKKQSGIELDLILFGRRAIMADRWADCNVVHEADKVLETPTYDFACKIAAQYCSDFETKKYDGVYIVYSTFQNAMSQVATTECLLPVSASSLVEGESSDKEPSSNYILEPGRQSLVDSLLQKHVANRIYKVLLDSATSEHAARMTAMDSATNNAEEVIRRLTLDYNRARQASITKELIEITSGAEAL